MNGSAFDVPFLISDFHPAVEILAIEQRNPVFTGSFGLGGLGGEGHRYQEHSKIKIAHPPILPLTRPGSARRFGGRSFPRAPDRALPPSLGRAARSRKIVPTRAPHLRRRP